MEFTRYAKPAAVVLLLAALVVVIVQNREPVQTHFLLITIEMPLILLLGLTAGIGFAIGLLMPALVRRSQRIWPRPGSASAFAEDSADHHESDKRAA